jgi:hypothetical protein
MCNFISQRRPNYLHLCTNIHACMYVIPFLYGNTIVCMVVKDEAIFTMSSALLSRKKHVWK